MARRARDGTAAVPPAAALAALVREGRLAVHVSPGSRQPGITIADGRVRVRVSAPPRDGAANAAVTGMVADAMGLPPSQVRLLRGAKGREKLLAIGGPARG